MFLLGAVSRLIDFVTLRWVTASESVLEPLSWVGGVIAAVVAIFALLVAYVPLSGYNKHRVKSAAGYALAVPIVVGCVVAFAKLSEGCCAPTWLYVWVVVVGFGGMCLASEVGEKYAKKAKELESPGDDEKG